MKSPDRVPFFEWHEAIKAQYRPCQVCQPHVLRLGDRPGFSHPALEATHVTVCGLHRPDSTTVVQAVEWGKHLGLLVVSYGATCGRVLYVPYGPPTEKQERERSRLLAGWVTADLAYTGTSTISVCDA